MIRHSLLALSFSLVAAAITGCAAEASDGADADADADLQSQKGALTSDRIVGDFHLETRSLDEAFLFDGAVSELSIVVSGADCHFQALQAKGGCDANTTCTDTDILSGDEHRARIDGSCSVTATKLTLATPNGELAFKVAPGTASHDRVGFILTSADGRKLSKAGSSAFFERTSRDPNEALSRSYTGGANDALTKSIKSSAPSLSPAVRAALKSLEDELNQSSNDGSSEVTDVFAVFATPFDSKPIAYAVEATTSGDHCGGIRVVGVDTDGKLLTNELQDGDC